MPDQHVSMRWDVFVPLTSFQERTLGRQEWLVNMARELGMIPAPDATYGVSTLMHYLQPHLWEDTKQPGRHGHAKDRPYHLLEELGIFDFDDCWRFNVLINVLGRRLKKAPRIPIPVLIDKKGRGPWKGKYADPEHARRALLGRLPERSEATLVQ